ncbi:MAG TPA: methylenetetrahydrofolate reductase [Xanthobacteraceae bacterium]|nr:methylenetetrahydrofolate reductase [Xanthobacteraceae bacterium]
MTSAPPPVPPAEPIEVARIAEFVRSASFEATRPSDAELDALAAAVPAGTRIYVSAIPARPPEEQIAVARRLNARGFEPVPHLAARNFPDTGALDHYLARMVDEAGVTRLLIIGGDRDTPAGHFHRAIEVIESGLPQSRGIREIGIAGFPEGHPRVAQAELDRALAAKLEAAAATGLSVYIVTQFAFSAAPVLDFIARLRDDGIDLPIRVGLAGPASVATLMRFAAICGVAVSARALARNAGLVKHLFGANAPDAIVRALAGARPGLGEVAPHFFTFGGLAKTARWAAAVMAGRIALDRAGGFRVEPP